MEPLTLRAVRPMSISGSIEISRPASATGRFIADSTISAAKVAPPPTPATPTEPTVTIADQLQDEGAGERIDADGRRDHHRQHRRVDAGAAVLADGRAERGGEVGDAFRRAEARGLGLHAHRNRAGAGARGEGERQHREDLLQVAARVQADAAMISRCTQNMIVSALYEAPQS